MSKTSQANKIAKEESKKTRKASKKVEETTTEVIPEVTKAKTEALPAEETPVEETSKVSAEGGSVSGGRKSRVRGKKYLAARQKVDPVKLYPLTDAIKLVKETSISSFDGKVEAHVTVLDIGSAGEIVLPHLDTVSKKIVILNDAILAEIKEGKINFDILIATPITMPKLLPFARTLGPKGLMPNPKSGTLTDKPEEAVKKLSVAKMVLRTEKKAPVIHVVVGKVSQLAEELEANVAELIRVIKPVKIKKLALCATMGPSVKVLVEK